MAELRRVRQSSDGSPSACCKTSPSSDISSASHGRFPIERTSFEEMEKDLREYGWLLEFLKMRLLSVVYVDVEVFPLIIK